jgi:NADH:ubiquinone reductase (H+-translocating)
VPAPDRKRVVIVGGGFGGLFAARALRGEPVDVTVIDRTNHHLFQPLLYQVATAGLAPSDITVPIRWILRNERNALVLLGNVASVDPAAREVRLADDAAPIPYDYLIVAAGSRHAYFGHDAWEPLAPGLKSLEDALEIRRRFLMAFERAERTDDVAARSALTTFVIVGGGPTGVELAGMMIEIVRKAMPRDFRRVETRKSRVILVEGGPRLLPSFPEKLSRHARADLARLGVEVRTDALVTSMDSRGVSVGDDFIQSANVFWAAGNQASPLGKLLGAPLDHAGRVQVQPDLSVPGHPELFVVGDLAAVPRANGSLVPGVAQGAMQGGRCAAKNVLRLIRGEQTRPFRYFNKGDMATIGRNRAVADFGWATLAGFPAWLLWVFIHIMYLIGFRNRAIVLLQWAYAYFTFQRGVRLIND